LKILGDLAIILFYIFLAILNEKWPEILNTDFNN
jgi:hypothetical protein